MSIDGRVATLGDKIDPAVHEVQVDGVSVNLDPNVRYYAFNKPLDVVTTMSDPQGRTDLTGSFPPTVPGSSRSEGWIATRSDCSSLTNDGDLANRLMHPSFGIEKEYLAEVQGTPTPKHLSRLRNGLELEGRPARANARDRDVSRGRGSSGS